MATSSVVDDAGGARAYHHGNLRAELLETAEQVLRNDGLERVTLRDLARKAGVSHAAPSRHFPDRAALLRALAASGYERLGQLVLEAVQRAGGDVDRQFRLAAATFVHFAIDNPALLDLMFTTGKGADADELRAATGPLYGTFGDLVERGLAAGRLRQLESDRLRPLVIAMLQGVAAFAANGRLTAGRVDALIEDACALFLN